MANEYVVTFRFPADKAGEFFTKFAVVMPIVQQFECISFEPEPIEESRDMQAMPLPEPKASRKGVGGRLPQDSKALSAEQFLVQHFKNKPFFTVVEAGDLLRSAGWKYTTAQPTIGKSAKHGVFVQVDNGVWRVATEKDREEALKPVDPEARAQLDALKRIQEEKRHNRAMGQLMGKGRPMPGEQTAYELLRDHFKDEEIFHIDQARDVLEEKGWARSSASPTLTRGRDERGWFQSLGNQYWSVRPESEWKQPPYIRTRYPSEQPDRPENP